MIQEPSEQNKPANHSRISRLLPDQRAAAAATALLVVGLAIGYIAGQQRPAMHEAEVRCLSAVRDVEVSGTSWKQAVRVEC